MCDLPSSKLEIDTDWRQLLEGKKGAHEGPCSSKVLLASEIPDISSVKDRTVRLGNWAPPLDCDLGQVARLKFRWDAPANFTHDAASIRKLEGQLIEYLGEKLNAIHDVNHPFSYWEIVIGPWVGLFTQIVYERLHTLIDAKTRYPSACLAAVLDAASGPYDDMQDFAHAVSSAEWNQALTQQLCDLLDLPLQTLPRLQGLVAPVPVGAAPATSPRRKFQRPYEFIARRILRRGSRLHLYNDYLPTRERFLLSLSFGDLPFIRPLRHYRPIEVKPVSNRMRTILVGNRDSRDDLGKLIHLIGFHLPKSYLEDYTRFCASSRAAGWPKSPTLIMSSNAFITDDDWKCWAGQAVEIGSRLVISQHGGHYGIGAISAAEDFECELADTYLSWGWNDRTNNKIFAAPAAKLLNLPNYKEEISSSGLLVVGSVPRWPHRVFSASLGPQLATYIGDQILFLGALRRGIRQEFTVRLPESDFGWNLERRFSEVEFPVHLDDTSNAFVQSAVRRRLIVGTYNGTAILETLAMGVPTVFFWNPNQWVVRDAAQPLFDELRNVGIFFDSPLECAGHVNRIWSDIPSWWKSRSVQQAVKNFTDGFARTSRRPIIDIRHILMSSLESE